MRSLRTKLLLPIMTTLLVIGIAAIWLVNIYGERWMDKEQEQRGRLLLDAISFSAERIDQQSELIRIAHAFGAQRDVALLMMIAGDDRRVLAANKSRLIDKSIDELPTELSDEAQQLIEQNAYARLSTLHSDTQAIHLGQPLVLANADYGSSLTQGIILLHLKKDLMQHEMRWLNQLMSLLLSALLVLIAGIIYIILRSQVLSPIQGVVDTLKARAAGDTQRRIPKLPKDEIGRVANTLNKLFDIQYRQELELRNERDRNQEFLDISQAIIVELDRQANVRLINSVGAAQLGYQVEDLIGRNWIEICLPEDQRPLIYEIFHKIISDETGETLQHVESEVITRSGERRYVFWRNHLLKDQHGRIQGTLSSGQDITERRQHEIDLHDYSERLSLATDAGGIGVWDWNLHSRNLTWDEQMYRLYGIDSRKKDNLYQHWLSCLHPDDRERMEKTLQKSIRQGSDFDEEFRVMRPDGSQHTIKAIARVEQNAAGIAHRMVGVNWDISERKHQEMLLQKTAEAARSASEAKSRFLANMSHEIRTPMNAVLGLCHLAGEQAENPEQIAYLQRIHSSAESLLGLLNDILDFSRIESGRLQLEDTHFQLSDIITHLRDILTVKTEEKNLLLDIQVDDDVPQALRGDPLRLRQILINLAGNAVKFTEKGRISIHIRKQGSKQHPPQHTLEFSVVDTGIGISEEQLSHLFNAFSQADASTTRRYGGSGLGLAISKQLVEMMGGQLEVSSSPGSGSRFSFSACFGQSRQKQTQENTNTPALTQRSLSGSTILIVEDNATNRLIAVKMLERAGAKIYTAENGEEGVEAARSKDIDAILMDCQMPVMDGYEATRRIRADISQTLPIIALTANVMPDDRKRCRDAGMNDFIGKPFKPEELIDTVHRCLEKMLSPPSPAVVKPPPAADKPQTPQTMILNSEDALQRLSGDEDLYRMLLADFWEDQRNVLQDIRRELAQNNQEEARRLAHSLKGAAANLGAEALQQSAYKAETAVREAGDIENALLELKQSLELFSNYLYKQGWVNAQAS